jgi:S-methylmethionine-dependent homocysteine/selenocysteine methylase/SAM-dependent methyltransferase
VILDGGVATELQRLAPAGQKPDPELWGTWALYQAPTSVAEIHRRYVDVGCDVISTDTWSILSSPDADQRAHRRAPGPTHWMDVARLGVRLARGAVDRGGRQGECAVAFTISEAIDSPDRRETVELLGRVFAEEPPDLILLETLTLVREPETFAAVELLLETGLPVWLSFRRCRHGVCGVYGQHWGPPEGDLFGRAAKRFEDMGVGALLINCLPIDHVPGMVSWLRDFTDLPLGVYPNLGYLGGTEWRFNDAIEPDDYARAAREWRAEGAQIIGGCCGVGPEHIAAAAAGLDGTHAGRKRARPTFDLDGEPTTPELDEAEPWVDERGRNLHPLPLPELELSDGVFAPTQGSFLVWKHLFATGAGKGQRCIDVGCGCGILAVQLALNGAESVHAIDIDRNAVATTLANAFRNGVERRVTGQDVDIYQWEPDEQYDVVAASLYQMPVDPFEQPTGHRPLDYWGRNIIDHFLGLLPRLLAPGGHALLMQLSIIGQFETSALLARHGLTGRVLDFSFFPFSEAFQRNAAQIRRVEELSDAYHHTIGGEDIMVAYLVEITR